MTGYCHSTITTGRRSRGASHVVLAARHRPHTSTERMTPILVKWIYSTLYLPYAVTAPLSFIEHWVQDIQRTSTCLDLTISLTGQTDSSHIVVAKPPMPFTVNPDELESPIRHGALSIDLTGDDMSHRYILNPLLRHSPPDGPLLLHMSPDEALWTTTAPLFLAGFAYRAPFPFAITELIVRSLAFPSPANLVAFFRGFPGLRRIQLVRVRREKPWTPYQPSTIHGVPDRPSHLTELHMLGGLHTLESCMSSVLLLHRLSET
ncbi:hypothetical protein BD309DRAFT_1051504 [Dichomitus squalens]|uniref:Uncharacterized protein n=1 Tax=Dichomitus squalens TaxID=114155 RepID=A0A4Q9PK68_9APHY|nr:hypothetical protein BD309DRAFT_1051504 [Dichomitus squalens]TBU54540.1 hypothetical protein BD310DRAFT_935646 [Dichomitus squalens]